MYTETKKVVTVGNKELPYAEVYTESREEALTIPSTDYVVGSKMYIVPTGEMFIACAAGWYDTDGTILA